MPMRFGRFLCLLLLSQAGQAATQETGGPFFQEIAEAYTVEQGLPSNDVTSLAWGSPEVLYAGTGKGLARYRNGAWSILDIEPSRRPVLALAANAEEDFAFISGSLIVLARGGDTLAAELPDELRDSASGYDLHWMSGETLLLRSDAGLRTWAVGGGARPAAPEWERIPGWGVPPPGEMRSIAVDPSGGYLAGWRGSLGRGAFFGGYEPVYPHQGARSWAPRNVEAVALDHSGRQGFASPQGVGLYDGQWALYTGADGLPYNDFTAMTFFPDGSVWFGTTKGAIHFGGNHWAYRQGRRWLPHDEVRAIVAGANGDAWIATAGGIGRIRNVSMTYGEKAAHYESEIDRYHRRTPYEYVLEVQLPVAGVKENVGRHDSDNDGLWTAMYGAAQCFAYGATKAPKAKARAAQAFGALQFLREVTQGGSHPAPPGYVARTILPKSGPDPNVGRLERDRKEKAEGDALWKVIDPRWPTGPEGKWYWKSDTSSDELDGHYFLYGLYYDLVAETESERTEVREHVRALTDHLMGHGFRLVDHDGRVTRWAQYSPEALNFDQNWFVERGLNSLSILSYLAIAGHITGDAKYRDAALELINKHGYAQNLMYPKFQRGVGTGNQSDDEMAFMCYYHLIKYETDAALRGRYALSLWQYWRLEQPELNPFFNFIMASQCQGATYSDAWGSHDVSPTGSWLEESLDTLKRFPLDRIDWRHTNSHRIDIMPMARWGRAFDEGERPGRGRRINGKALPVDERFFNHWNTDPFRLDQGGAGHSLGDGTVFLLPYYMGLYHGFIKP